MSLRDAILTALSSLPHPRTLHLHTLVSTPKRDNDLFLYAPNKPKVYSQHILVLLAQHPSGTPEERVFVCAIEAFLYSIPSTSSAILYISKVDSTGQGSADIRPNATHTLVTAFLRYYSNPATRPAPNLWIHVFARAQNQYLFPNSAEYAGKRVLRDTKLCKWWKNVLEVVGRQSDPNGVRLYYLLPGFSSTEAIAATTDYNAPKTNPYPWTYSHPYHQTDVPVPCGIVDDVLPSIAELIPSFPDDPKTRFIAEIAAMSSETDAPLKSSLPSPRQAKRPRVTPDSDTIDTIASGESNSPPPKASGSSPIAKRKSVTDADVSNTTTIEPKPTSSRKKIVRALVSVSPDEFWERMSFRQECSLGAITGFFTATFSSPNYSRTSASLAYEPAVVEGPGEVAPYVLDRVVSMLMNLDFGTADRARRSTAVLNDAIRGLLCSDQSSTSPLPLPPPVEDGRVVSVPPLDSSREAEPTKGTPITSAQSTLTPIGSAFETYMYASIIITNDPLPTNPTGAAAGSSSAAAPPVTILQVRKKKRPAS